ncbi:hypothetical protein JHK85_013352 [Glycine max]|uniref:Uncharacterized protein n=1 Tax=Glycine max TaxID=3847 RepID=A0A0R0K3X1_SOYBN|nr:hypothetical protein JHK85_013352 [Glycine max]KAG5058016.1 hypothetical protein JHK86_013012 [Glycine max]
MAIARKNTDVEKGETFNLRNQNKTNKPKKFNSNSKENIPPPSCSRNETPLSHDDEDPPQDDVLKAISGICEAEVIIRGEICICKYWADSSCFQ